MANDGLINKVLAGGVLSDLEALNNKLLVSLETISKLNKEASSVSSFSGANKVLKERAKLEDDVAIAEKERIRLLKALKTQEERNKQILTETSTELAKQRYETQRLNKVNKENAILTSRYASAYEKLSVELNQAKRNLKDLIITEGQFSKSTAKARVEVDKLSAKMKLADNTAGDFQKNVGNYPTGIAKGVTALKGLVGAFGAIEGVRIAYDFSKESLELARQAEGVEFAYKRLGSTGVNAFNEIKSSTNGLISDLSIKTSLVEFDNFGLSLERTSTLFEFLAVTATQTGKSVQELESSLVEGLSKQSTQRIDNLGISATALNEELEKTPDFVEAVANIAERKLAKAGNILDEASNSSSRLSSSVENLKVAFGQFLNSGDFGALGFLSDQIERITDGVKLLQRGFLLLNNGVNNFLTPIKDLVKRIPILNTLTSNLLNTIKGLYYVFTQPGITAFGFALTRVGAVLSGLGAVFTEATNQAFNFVKTLAEIGDIGFTLNPFDNFTKASEYVKNTKNTLLNGGKEVASAFIKGYNDALNFRESEEIVEELSKNINSVLGDGDKKAIEGTIAGFKEIISELTDLRDGTATTTEEWKKYDDQIAVVERNIKRLKEGLDSLNEIQGDTGGIIDLSTITGSTLEQIDTASIADIESGVTVKLQEEKDKQQAILKSFQDGVLADYDGFSQNEIDSIKKNLQFQEDLIKASQDAVTSLVVDGTDAVLQARIDAIDAEIDANQDKLDLILDSETASDEAKIIAQAKFDKEEAKLEDEKAEEEKKQFLFSQAIALSEVAIQAAKGINYATAQAPATLGASLSWIPLILGTATAQAGLILAQSLPAFKYGKGANSNYEGEALLNDGGKDEVRVNKYGQAEVLKGRNIISHIDKDDLIIPSVSTFKRQVKDPSSDLYQRVTQKITGDTNARQSFILNNNTDTKGIERAITRAMSKHKAPSFNPNIIVKQPRRRKY